MPDVTEGKEEEKLKNYFTLSLEALTQILECNTTSGLSQDEAQKRLQKYGTNELRKVEKIRLHQIISK